VTIPLATTTIAVQAMTEPEPGEGRTATTVATGRRAVIGSPSGVEAYAPGGGTASYTHGLRADPTPELADNTCVVVDEATGERFEVAWVVHRRGLGLDHTVAGLTRKVGRG
jgi:hypothetical protein